MTSKFINISPSNLKKHQQIGDDVYLFNLDSLELQENVSLQLELSTVIIVLSGGFSGYINFQKVEASEHCLVIMLRNQILEINNIKESTKIKCISFSTKFGFRLNLQTDFALMNALNANHIVELNSKLFRTLLGYYKTMTDASKLKNNPHAVDTALHITLAMYFAVAHTLHQTDVEEINSNSEKLVQEFLKLAKIHCRERQKVSFYAEKMHLTPRYISQIVRDTTNKTIKEWLTEYTIEKAQEMLLTTRKSVDQISQELNFPDASTFGKYFRSFTKQTPSEFRKLRRPLK